MYIVGLGKNLGLPWTTWDRLVMPRVYGVGRSLATLGRTLSHRARIMEKSDLRNFCVLYGIEGGVGLTPSATLHRLI